MSPYISVYFVICLQLPPDLSLLFISTLGRMSTCG